MTDKQILINALNSEINQKEYEISDLNMKTVRQNKEADFQIAKLKEEIERLRSDLMYEEA